MKIKAQCDNHQNCLSCSSCSRLLTCSTCSLWSEKPCILQKNNEHILQQDQWWERRNRTRRDWMSILKTILLMGAPPQRAILPGVRSIMVATIWMLSASKVCPPITSPVNQAPVKQSPVTDQPVTSHRSACHRSIRHRSVYHGQLVTGHPVTGHSVITRHRASITRHLITRHQSPVSQSLGTSQLNRQGSSCIIWLAVNTG